MVAVAAAVLLSAIMQVQKERGEEITKHVLVGWICQQSSTGWQHAATSSPLLLSSPLVLVLIIGSARDRKSGLKFDLAEVVAGKEGAAAGRLAADAPSLVPPLFYPLLPPRYSNSNQCPCQPWRIYQLNHVIIAYNRRTHRRAHRFGTGTLHSIIPS